MTKPRFIVHLGFPKCGSTSLQVSIAKDVAALESVGTRQFGIGNGYEWKLLAYLKEENEHVSEELGNECYR